MTALFPVLSSSTGGVGGGDTKSAEFVSAAEGVVGNKDGGGNTGSPVGKSYPSSVPASSSSSSPPSCLSLPTVVQLHCPPSSSMFRLESSSSSSGPDEEGGAGAGAFMPSYAVLTYQAVQVTGRDGVGNANVSQLFTGGRSNKKIVHAVPDLGVWNCCVTATTTKKKSPSLHGPSSTAGGGSSSGGGPAGGSASAGAATSSQGGSDNDKAGGGGGGGGGGTNAASLNLSDSLLRIPSASNHGRMLSTFCFSVDLSNLYLVEPALTKLQECLVRYLISQPPAAFDDDDEVAGAGQEEKEENVGGGGVDDAGTTKTSVIKTKTTSLRHLRSVQFGLAPDDEESANKISTGAAISEDEDRRRRVALMICVRMPLRSPNSKKGSNNGGGGGGGGGGGAAGKKGGQSSPSAGGGGPGGTAVEDYRQKQAREFVVYHLRRYAAALNASLCFVNEDVVEEDEEEDDGDEGNKDKNKQEGGEGTGGGESQGKDAEGKDEEHGGGKQEYQPILSLDQLAFAWRELALGHEVWNDDESPELYPSSSRGRRGKRNKKKTEGDAAKDENVGSGGYESAHSLIYGPGCHHEDLVETVLLRNASYPGHWDASKDSVWKILPPPPAETDGGNARTSSSAYRRSKSGTLIGGIGDEGWLSELRDSVASAAGGGGDASSVASGGTTSTAASTAAASTATATKDSAAGGGVSGGAGGGKGVAGNLATPQPKPSKRTAASSKRKKDASASAASRETPSEAAVSSFFENLLKDGK